MPNQFIRIQTRYISPIARGCQIDGLAASTPDVSPFRHLGTFDGNDPFPWMSASALIPTAMKAATGLTKRPHRQWHWHSLLNCVQLQQH
ncbi:MAG: hypothetical protein F6J95_002950 [Leptolyngbya sp. SIO1E4]|nr:hypothetical protein [Leptolyngbya sp. SIO1E4]